MVKEPELVIDCSESMLESYRLFKSTGDPDVLPENWKEDSSFLESLKNAEDAGLRLVAAYSDDEPEQKENNEVEQKLENDAVPNFDYELYMETLKPAPAQRPKIDEVLIPLWPHTNNFDEKHSEAAKKIAVVFLIIWVAAALWHFVQLFNSSTYYILKIVVIALVPLYAFTQGTTHILFDRKGLNFQSRLAGSNSTRWHIDWQDIDDVYMEQPTRGTLLDWKLKVKQKNGITHTIKLSKIATREQWHNLIDAFNKWCPVKGRGVDRDIFDSISLSRQDPTYTTLWLQALSSPPKRERLQPLIEGAVLQNSKYEVTKILGSGGQGTAYLANKKDTGPVVLKEYILPVFVDAKVRREAIETFNHETEVLKRVHSPLIVSLEEAFIEDNRAYLVLEYVDGPSLKAEIAEHGVMKEKEAVKHALKMCDMLAHLHSLTPSVIHRDFTPDNLILTSTGELKLIDFMVAQDSTDNIAGTAMGKQAFMPPEQLRGKATICSDLYALGGTVFYMLTGQYPEAISQSRPSMFNSHVSVELDEIVNKCTALNAAERYQSASEIRVDLEKCLAESVSL